MIVEGDESGADAEPATTADEDEGPGDVVGPPSRRRRVARAVGSVAVLMAALIVVDVLLLWARVERFPLRRVGSAPGGTTYLLLGSDSREFVTSAEDRVRYGGSEANPGERADVLLLLRVDGDGVRRLLSIPRDLLVVDQSGALIRIAESYGRGGPQGVVDALCESLGIGVDHVAVTRLDGLRAVVNAIGGVEIRLDTPVRDRGTGLDLPAGEVHLDGDLALQYVGSRRLEHREPNGRWRERATDSSDRAGRVAEVLGLVGERADLSPWSPIRGQKVVWAATTALSVDESMGVGDALDVRSALQVFGGIDVEALPVTSTEGRVTIDQVGEGAGRHLDRFEGDRPRSDRCADPKFALARR